MEQLNSLLTLLATQRRELSLTSEDIASQRDALELRLIPLKERRQLCKDKVEATEAEIRALALQMYKADPEHRKEVHPKVHERDMTKVEYNSEQAYDWCVSKGLFLNLATKDFEHFCRTSSQKPVFVTVRTEPQITIAKEL